MNRLLEKRKSPIHGSGIFANYLIHKGEVFYTIPLKQVSKEPRSHLARIAPSKYVSDERVLHWLNHSCEPNTFLNIDANPPTLIALHDILADEEIVCDYSRTEVGGVKVSCACGSEKCKGYFLRIE